MERLWSRAVATVATGGKCGKVENGSDSRKPLPWVAINCRGNAWVKSLVATGRHGLPTTSIVLWRGHFPSSAKRGGVPRAEGPEARVPTLILQPEIVILPVRAARDRR